MRDREISATLTIAGGLWALALGLVAAEWFVPLGEAGLFVAGIAVTATVRYYFVRSNDLIRAAFRLGRDGPDAVRPLH